MTTLIDTSVLLDIVAPSQWRAWSERELIAASERGPLAINQIISAELAAGFASKGTLERSLQGVGLRRLNLPWAAAWLASQAFIAYRRGGGTRAAPLPDFFVGAHAEAAGLALLTRDPARIRTYFPAVEVIAPP
ncbi:MAG: type II toxin-antitoxin system VapC family toxin [Solirubrobacteraceae bacterium]